MKKIISATFFLMSSLLIFAQNNHDRENRNGNRSALPSPVQQAWQHDHFNDGTPQWNQTNGQWHAKYEDKTSNKKVDSYYDQKGHQIDTHRQLESKDMPSQYNQNVYRRYHTSGNYNVTKIERPNQNEVYQLQIKNKGKNKTIYTDQKGNDIKYRDPHRN